MPLPSLRIAVLAASLSACLSLSATPKAMTQAQALEAIQTFEGNLPTGISVGEKSAKDSTEKMAAAANAIVQYAIQSDSVVVDMGPDSVTWCDVKKGVAGMAHSGERGLLFAAYLAGEIKAQLHAGKSDPNPYAGWVETLHVYKALRLRDGLKIAEIEVLAQKQKDGSLEAFAAEAAKRSVARLEASYHGERPVSIALTGQ